MRHRTRPGLHSVLSQTTLIRSVLVLLCTLNIVFTSWSPAAAQDSAFSSPADQILNDVNQARIDNGLPPLAVSPLLMEAAQRHVDDIVANGNWGHYGSDGSNIQLRVARVGYPSSSVSENWVAVSDPSQAIGWWMNDWIHRVNILEPRWDEIGVGAAQAGNGFWILVTDFGNIDGGAMPPVVESAPVTQLTAGNDISAQAIPENGEYAIQGGDTLMGIAIRFGLDWQDIALANDMSENELLQIGRVIRLPIPNGGGSTAETGASAGKQVHVVRTGETLWTISARYQVAWQDIAAVNDLSESDFLQIGQELKLPASLDEPEEQPAEEPAEEPVQEDVAAAEEQPVAALTANPANEEIRFVQQSQKSVTQATYTVKSGDTLLAIAINQKVSWQQLAEVNDLSEDSFLQIGQELRLPPAPDTVPVPLAEIKAAAKVPAAGSSTDSSASSSFDGGSALARVHSVKAGDTVYGIALQYGVDWEELLRFNGLQEDSLLQLGQELRLP